MKINSTWGKVFENMGRPLTLFNEYPNVCQKANALEDEPLIRAYETDDEDDYPEVFQWYIVNLSEWDVEWLEKISQGTIKCYWSELLGLYIMPVYHWGTPWDGVHIELDMDEGTPKDLWEADDNA